MSTLIPDPELEIVSFTGIVSDQPTHGYSQYYGTVVTVIGICVGFLICWHAGPMRLIRTLLGIPQPMPPPPGPFFLEERLPKKSVKKLKTKPFDRSLYNSECTVCLQDFKLAEKVRVLPCNHAFHKKCIDPWLTKSVRVCPNCKAVVYTPGEKVELETESTPTPVVPTNLQRSDVLATERQTNPLDVAGPSGIRVIPSSDNSQQPPSTPSTPSTQNTTPSAGVCPLGLPISANRPPDIRPPLTSSQQSQNATQPQPGPSEVTAKDGVILVRPQPTVAVSPVTPATETSSSNSRQSTPQSSTPSDQTTSSEK